MPSRKPPDEDSLPLGMEHPQAIDLMAAFARRHAVHTDVETRAQVESVTSPSNEQERAASRQIRRLRAVQLRATVMRVRVLTVLEQSSPDCLDVHQILHAFHQRFGIVAPATVYRALKEMTYTGLLVRTWGAHGRARYNNAPEGSHAQTDTLACRCGKRQVFIKNLKLHAHLNVLASEEGFVLHSDSVFTISTVCAGCKDAPQNRPRVPEARDAREQSMTPTLGDIYSMEQKYD